MLFLPKDWQRVVAPQLWSDPGSASQRGFEWQLSLQWSEEPPAQHHCYSWYFSSKLRTSIGSMVWYTSWDTGKAPLDLVVSCVFTVFTMQEWCNGSGLFVCRLEMTKDIKGQLYQRHLALHHNQVSQQQRFHCRKFPEDLESFGESSSPRLFSYNCTQSCY